MPAKVRHNKSCAVALAARKARRKSTPEFRRTLLLWFSWFRRFICALCRALSRRLFCVGGFVCCVCRCSGVVRSACVLEYSGVRVMRSAFSGQRTLCARRASPCRAACRLWSKASVPSVSAAIQIHQQRHNKALHPTAYSSVRSSLRFRRRVSLVVLSLARGVAECDTYS
jgi:hypothetical protein